MTPPTQGEEGSGKCLCYSINLFSKMGYKGEGGVKNLKKWVTPLLKYFQYIYSSLCQYHGHETLHLPPGHSNGIVFFANDNEVAVRYFKKDRRETSMMGKNAINIFVLLQQHLLSICALHASGVHFETKTFPIYF